ncbi:MAG: hypothetical protein COC01_08665 [Bacteroidetes bacterium]|nr:MAG: hypothetical protein COC01_08665 [Bacteroidota bacterium]
MVQAAKSTIDSLRTAYQTATHDTTKINALNSWGEEIYLTNPDSALTLLKKAKELSIKNLIENLDKSEFLNVQNAFKKGLATAYNNIGTIYNGQGEIEKALEYYLLGMNIQEEIKDKEGVATSYNNIGTFYYNQGKVEKALEYFFLSLKIQEEVKDKYGMAYSFNNIGFIYYSQGEIEKALEYFFLNLKISKEIKDKKGMANSYNNIGSIYNNQGEIEKALEYFHLGLKINVEIRNKYGMSMSYHNIGYLLRKQDSIAEGLRYLELGLSLDKELGNKAGVSVTTSAIGVWQLKLKKVEAALKSGLEALTVAKEIGHVEYMKRAARLLSGVYKKQGKFEDAFTMYELEIQMRDSIVNEANTKATIKQQMKYEYEKEQIIKEQKEKEQLRLANEAQSRRDNLHYTAIFIGILLVFGLILMLGFVKVNPKSAEAIIFISFLIVFEFLLILADPYVEEWSGGAPGWKLLFNAVLAGLIFPLHQFFEGKLKKRLIKVERKKRGRMSGGHSSHHVSRMLMIGLLVVSHSLGFAQRDTTKIQNEERSQLAKLDSLNNLYSTAMHDTTRVDALLGLAEEYYLSNPDTALTICEKALKISKKANLQIELADCYGWLAYLVGNNGEIQKALEYEFKGVMIYEKMLSEKLENRAFLNSDEEIKKGIAISYNNIGSIYDNQGEIEKALEYYFLSFNLYEELKDKRGMAYSYNNIGYINYYQGKREKALEYYFLSLKLREEIKDKKGMAESYHNIGSTLCNLDSLNEGMRYLQVGLGLMKEAGHKAGVSASYASIGSSELKMDHIEVALESGLKALAIATQIGHVEYMERGAKLLSDVYKKQGKFEDALTMYELEIEMRDSIINEENQKATIRQQMKYEHEKEQIIKDQQLKEQARIKAEATARRDNLHYSAIFIGILILFGGVLMLGFVKVRPKDVEGIIFVSFLILFEFVLVLADPHIEQYTGGAPAYKLIFNAGIAGLIFPLHQFFGGKLRKRIIKAQRKKTRERMEQHKKDIEEL